MTDPEILFKKIVKEEIQNIQYLVGKDDNETVNLHMHKINEIIKQLCMIPDESLHKNIEQFLNNRKEIADRINVLSKEIVELSDRQHNNYKNLYENVLLKI